MKNDFKAIVALITAYTTGNFLLLLNRGLYWDAWEWMTLLKENNFALMWSLTDQSKLYTHYFVMRLAGLTNDPVFFVNLLAFVSWLLSGLFIYGILRKKMALRIDRAFFLSACYMLIPTLLIKVGQSIIHYSTNNMLFFGAVFLYFLVEENKNPAIRYGGQFFSWVLFFLSFLTNSFLVFYGGFLLLILASYYQKNSGQPTLPLFLTWLKNNFLFVILPVIFWILKTLVWVPEGIFAGYNQFIGLNSSSLALLARNIWQNIAYGFFWPILAPLDILDRKIFTGILLIITGFFYLLAKKIFLSNSDGIEFSPKKYLSSGLFLLALGAAPYLLVAKAPHIFGYGFGMRHALLLPLGSSLVILGTITAIIRDRWQFFVQILILALFTTFTIYNYFWLDMDWYKQQAIIEVLAENSSIQNYSSIIFYDKAGINWQNRNITSGEYFNHVQMAFPKNNVQFVSAEGNDPAENYQSSIQPDDSITPAEAVLKIKSVKMDIISKSTEEIMTAPNWLKIKKSEIFSDQKTFLENIKNIYRIEIVPSSE